MGGKGQGGMTVASDFFVFKVFDLRRPASMLKLKKTNEPGGMAD